MDIKYINHKGETLDLSEWPYILQPESLFDFEWQYRGKGGRTRIDEFYFDIVEKELTVAVHAETLADFRSAMQNFYDVTQKDISELRPGRIQLDHEYYLSCYITADAKAFWHQGINTSFRDIKVVTDTPMWTHEKLYHFGAAEEETNIPAPDWGLDYPYDYPYDYTAGGASRIVNVESISAGDFRIVVFGPAINPSITIGPNTYAVGSAENQLTLTQSEYLVIDSRSKTIVRHHPDGTTESALNYRNKEREFFVKIPPGKSHIVSNVFFDITVYEYRSEPPWM